MATEPHTHPENQPPANQPPAREREVIVTDGGGRSGMSGALVAVLAIIVIAIIAFFVINAIGGAADDMDAPSVDVPSEMDVNVDSGGE